MKHSIRIRLMMILTGLVAFAIFTCWLVNRMNLVDYYQSSKLSMFGKVYAEVNQIYNRAEADLDESSDEVSLALEKLGANQDLSLYVVDLFQIRVLYETKILTVVIYPSSPSQIQQEQVKSRVEEYLNYTQQNMDGKEKELLESEANYNIFKVLDERIQSNYIELFGILDNGHYILMKANFESMKESVSIANKFLAYIGIGVIIASSILMFFISKSFTKPIQELSGIAKRMSDLDFDVKYGNTRQDEIGELGNSINVLSDKLEHTISELKSANNELMTDIENKIQIDEMRKEFLSNVSHELKTPIALIQGYAEGLKENISDDQESRDFYCEVIMDEANKMNKMVKKLLSLNQIEFGNNQINFERFDITALIKNVLASTDILFRQKNAVLRMEEYGPVYVWADEYMIEEVVTNYISNALNHADGERIIEIRMEQKEDVCRICVYNTGDRIPEEELEKVWIKFYKVDKARTREYGGSGIGLSIVRAIMNSLNRECGVENKEEGVEFWFEVDRSNG